MLRLAGSTPASSAIQCVQFADGRRSAGSVELARLTATPTKRADQGRAGRRSSNAWAASET